MSILPSSNIRRYDDVEELVDISVSMPLFTADTLTVYYGEAGLDAIQNVDYEIILNEVDYSNFTFRPLESLILKIDAQIVAEPTDRNTVLLVRTLPLSTASSSAAARSSDFVSKEFDRITMKLQQIEERIERTFGISIFDEFDYENMLFPSWSAGAVIAWDTTLKQLANSDSTVFQGEPGPAGPPVADGDKGHIIVASGGTVWTFDPAIVTPFALTLLDDADQAAMQATLGIVAPVVFVSDTQQPTTDVTEVVTTGLSGCRVVEVWYAFTHNNAGAANYTLQGRVSGGAWRDICVVQSIADATSAIYFHATITNFNVAGEKVVDWTTRTSSSVLDDSDASNVTGQAGTSAFSYTSFKEIWSELKVVSSIAGSIEGDTPDQRGRWYVEGHA